MNGTNRDGGVSDVLRAALMRHEPPSGCEALATPVPQLRDLDESSIDNTEHEKFKAATLGTIGKPLRWRIYYNTAQRVGSHQKTWEEARRSDIVAIVWQKDGPVQVELGTQYYCYLEDWIARCWDPTLYLRKLGVVKFGRWAKLSTFLECWRQAVAATTRKAVAQDHDAISGSVVCATHAAESSDPLFLWRAWYDDGKVYTGYSMEDWNQLPSDGLMCVYYHHVLNGIVIAMAVRRYTYYCWKNGELLNTDDLEEVLEHYPSFKRGSPAFTGKSYLHQALAISEAMKDTLDDIP